MIHEAAEHIPKFLLGSSDGVGIQKPVFRFWKCTSRQWRRNGFTVVLHLLQILGATIWVFPQALSLPTQKELHMIESFISKFVRVTDENELILIN